VPTNGLYLSCACLLLGAVLIYLVPDVVEAFTTVSAVLSMFVWTRILLSYMRYRENRAALHETSSYKMLGRRWW